ncbi:iron chelate uptake ABC transporter family permease subunit [Aestuariibacter sp. AA17]|uniref:Iron chelate uptake ABC transporter family permease subunit n=1 Tax=Fluctibacter corallii TaxID=2984329 RepID=A0ABT3ACG8_9ALTE|nr:iron chelate uptake ABC transporter family permease subunit [Aestuariibacter sp. AA17]MCV2885982.1 iron chelate uptake ABC transporter family permease subunit [Aestuariibacter sp. AA17]
MAKAPLLSALLIAMLALGGTTLLWGMSFPFSAIEQRIVLDLRLPLVITSIIVGAALATSSAALQVVLKNPLADPGIIGITSGASVCAAVVLLIGEAWLAEYGAYILPLACFIGAVGSTLVIYRISRALPGVHSAVILAGIGISTIAGAIVAWLHLISDAESMRNLTFWLMGSLHQADWTVLLFAAPVAVGLLTWLLRQGTRLNWFYFGATEARLKGLDVSWFNGIMLLVCALLVGIAVSIAGSIAFVGLLVPHLIRNIAGFDNRFVLPASAMVGAMLMLAIALINTQFVTMLVPVSMLTASIGGPLFLWSVIRLSKGQT